MRAGGGNNAFDVKSFSRSPKKKSRSPVKPGKGFGWLLFYGIYSPLAFGRSSLAVDRLLPHTQLSWIRIPDAVECWWLMMMDTTTTDVYIFSFSKVLPLRDNIIENSAKSTPSLSSTLPGLQWLHPAYLVSLACNPHSLHSLPLSPPSSLFAILSFDSPFSS